MKRILTILLFVTSAVCTMAQDYYWSNNKKNYLENIDNKYIVKRDAKAADSMVNHFITESTQLHASQIIRTELSKQELKNSGCFLKVANVKKMGDLEIIPTGDILIKPIEGVEISSILDLFPNGIAIKSSSVYNTYVLTVSEWDSLYLIANQIYESGLVEYSHPDFISQIARNSNDELYGEQYYLNNSSGVDINMAPVWDILSQITPTVIKVAVIDDGVEAHEDLGNRVLSGYTASTSSANPNTNGAPNNSNPPCDGYTFGHGQCCAGIIAASHNAIGIKGINPTAQIVPINIFNNLSSYYVQFYGYYCEYTESVNEIAVAIDKAWDDFHADVLSNSWSYKSPNIYYDAIASAINRARIHGRNGKGSIVIFGSGNRNNICSGVLFPANVEGVITVGAVHRDGSIWNYSSRGSEMDVVAPSGACNLEGDITTIDRMGNKGFESGNYTHGFGGTSAACPQVAGVASLILAINPELTESQVRDIIRQTATDLGANGFDCTYGYGLINAFAAVNAAGFDLFTKDNEIDNGAEPLTHISVGIDNSPDIWLRRHADNGTSHQVARHNSVNYVYVNVGNRGVTQSNGTDSIELYVKKATLSIDYWPNRWTKIGSVVIPEITSGGTRTVRIDGHFPSVENNYPHNHPYITLGNNVDYAMLTRIVSENDMMTHQETSNTFLNVINNNNISYKNVVVSSAMFFDDIFEQIAILDIDNAGGPRYRTNIHLTSPQNNDGAQLFKESEIRLVFERHLLELWRNSGAEFVGLKPIDDTTFLVTSPNAAINGATIPEDYYGYMRMQTNFLTHEYTDKFSYEYHVSEYDIHEERVIGSATIVVYKNPRDVLFDAKAGNDFRVKKNANALLSAESINEDAVYNWYNASGELIGSGDTLSVNVTATSKYKLEVIAKADGYKDYDSVYVIAIYGSIEGMSPNPANTQTVVSYDLSEEITSATIVISNATGQVLYSAPLDVTQTTHTVNLQAIPTGQYTVRIESQGSPLDSQTLIVY